jgi:hypothetical protein
MAWSKLLFVGESKNQVRVKTFLRLNDFNFNVTFSKQNKLEFYVDFKGGKCYKLDVKDKEHSKLSDFIRHSKNTFIVSSSRFYIG